VGSVPAGNQVPDCKTAAIRAPRDVAPITCPRVWSVRCHRVELPPRISAALLPGCTLVRTGNYSLSSLPNVAIQGRCPAYRHNFGARPSKTGRDEISRQIARDDVIEAEAMK
jgi:hypothetical protein